MVSQSESFETTITLFYICMSITHSLQIPDARQQRIHIFLGRIK